MKYLRIVAFLLCIIVLFLAAEHFSPAHAFGGGGGGGSSLPTATGSGQCLNSISGGSNSSVWGACGSGNLPTVPATGQALFSSAGSPTWAAFAGGSDLTMSNTTPGLVNITRSLQTCSTSPCTVMATYVLCNAASGAIVLNLPASSGSGRPRYFKKTDSTANACTVTRNGTDTIDAGTTFALGAQYEAIEVEDSAAGVWSIVHTAHPVTQSLPAHNFAISTSATGAIAGAQPAFTDISGTAQVAQGGTGATAAGATAANNIGALAQANNLADLANVATARASLGLGTAAVVNTPISIANGGTGTASPGGTSGTGLSVSGSFPTQQYALVTPVTPANGGTGTITVPTSGQIPVGNVGGTAYAPASMSGDATLASTGAITVTKTSGVAFASSATTDTTNASNISSGTLAAARGGAGTVNGILKANGSGMVSQAVSSTDYAPATSGSAILKGNGTGGFSSAVSGTDYQGPIAGNNLPAHQFATTINSAGTITGAQPQFTDVSGTAAISQGGTQCPGVKTFATLPTGVQGMICTITDASSCAAGTAVSSGGGSTICTLTYNGTSWFPAGGATGGSGTPGGTTGQIQFNNSGAFGGVTAVPVANGGTGTVTAPTSGQLPVGNAGGTAYAPVSMSGDATLSNAGAIAVTKTNGVAFASSATTDTTNASNISSGTLAVARGGTQCGTPSTFAGLPGSPTAGEQCSITDAPVCGANAIIGAGGGSLPCLLTYNGTNWVAGGGSTGIYQHIANNATTGTSAFHLFTRDSSNNAVSITAGSTSGAMGICINSCGTTGSGNFLVTPADTTCTFDSAHAIARNDYIGISASVTGDCTDLGATPTAGQQIVGQVETSSGTGPGNFAIYFYGPSVSGGNAVTPGGTSGQIQFNSSGTFGGVTAVPVANGGTQCAGPQTSFPGSPTAGEICYFTNASACTPGTAIVLSGSTSCQGTYNGTNWLPSGGASGGAASAGGSPGNPQYNSSGSIAGIANIIHAGAGSSTALQAAFAAVPQITWVAATHYTQGALIYDGTNTQRVADWEPNHSYLTGDTIIPGFGNVGGILFKVTSANCLSGPTHPTTWNPTTTDNTCTWTSQTNAFCTSGGSAPTWSTLLNGKTVDNTCNWTLAYKGAAAPSVASMIVADPGQTYNLAAPIAVGMVTQIGQTLFIDGANVHVTNNGGAGQTGVIEGNWGRVVGRSRFNSSITGDSAASVDSLIETNTAYLYSALGVPYQQQNGDISHINVSNGTATIGKAVVWLSGIDGNALIEDVYVNPPISGANTGILVDDAPSGSAQPGFFWNGINFQQVWIGMGPFTTGLDVECGTTSNSSGSNLVWNGGEIVDPSANSATWMKFNGVNANCRSIKINAPYFEGAGGTGGTELLANNTNSLIANAIYCNVGSETNCAKVTGVESGLHIDGYNVNATNALNDTNYGVVNTSQGQFTYDPVINGMNLISTSTSASGTTTLNMHPIMNKFTLANNSTLNFTRDPGGDDSFFATAQSPTRFGIEVCQNGTGNFTLAFGTGTGVSSINWSGGTQPGYTLTAGNGDFYNCNYNGASVYCVETMANVPCE